MFVYILCTPGAQKWSVACVIWDDVSLDVDMDAQIVSCRNDTPRPNLLSHSFINVFFLPLGLIILPSGHRLKQKEGAGGWGMELVLQQVLVEPFILR